eukprot:m.68472 g.68472  ORF g.68472 m.68472 type:complete len:92 (-) comp11608_c0_seq30:3588-3863(-)
MITFKGEMLTSSIGGGLCVCLFVSVEVVVCTYSIHLKFMHLFSFFNRLLNGNVEPVTSMFGVGDLETYAVTSQPTGLIPLVGRKVYFYAEC